MGHKEIQKKIKIGLVSTLPETYAKKLGIIPIGGVKKSMEIAKDIIGKTESYLSFDIDGIDPTFAPGTGTPEVGGFSVRESQQILRELKGINFVGADVVEVSPPFDLNNQTSLVAANIAFEILCTMTRTN